MPSDDDEAYEGPDAYVEGDDNVSELEVGQDDLEAQSRNGGSGATIAQILRSLFDMQQLRPSNAPETTTISTSTTNDEHPTLGSITYGDLVRLLRTGPSSGNQNADEDVDNDDDDEDYVENTDWNQQWFPPNTKPEERGVELLMSGEFGRVSSKLKSNHGRRNISRLLLDRFSTPRGTLYREELANELIPNSNGTAVASHGANLYVGQYSKDSSFYYTCSQDFRLHVYDMTSPPAKYVKRSRNVLRGTTLYDESEHDHESTLKVLKTIQGHPGRWTITDSHLSPDNERQSPTVYMTNTLDSSTIQTPIRFHVAEQGRRRSLWGSYEEESFGIWSCRFSADGNEVIAGGSGHIFVYDLLADRRTVKIVAHSDDVNSCCWADTASGNVLISASDDTFLKVWDRRSLGASQKPSGVLVGHTEGITNVSAKGDGRYVISNGKDQALRLWDLRKMCGSDDFDKFSHRDYRLHNYDYRYGYYPKPKRAAHPNDCSVMTYRGHAVFRTLIRCNFSPTETTGGQYIYSGSADGKIHIWSLDGRLVQILDRSQCLPISVDPSGPELGPLSGPRAAVCVRDVSWSSKEPVLMSVGWENSRVGGSVVARHEWKGLSKMAYSLEDFNEKQRTERTQGMAMRTAAAASPRIPEAHLFGFPAGYFVIRSVATGRLLDVSLDEVEDGTEIVLWPEKEQSLVESLRNPDANNQVYFIDTSGALCSRSSGHAVDVEGDRLVLRHRRPVSKPYPNAYSHPLPQFSYNRETQEISVIFSCDPTYPPPGNGASNTWRRKKYILSSVPMRKPKSLIDNASDFLSTAVAAPFSFLSGGLSAKPKSTPEEVFGGDIDLREDEMLEQDRGEEGEVDDSYDLVRKDLYEETNSRARKRRQWQVLGLRTSAAPRRV
ncbi:WD40 repeat-like protein [Melanogaster broomeanus]|nr:WD40 repeat-like protein [Melanogaster broomeanus]